MNSTKIENVGKVVIYSSPDDEQPVNRGTLEWNDTAEGRAYMDGKQEGYEQGYEDCFDKTSPLYDTPSLMCLFNDLQEESK